MRIHFDLHLGNLTFSVRRDLVFFSPRPSEADMEAIRTRLGRPRLNCGERAAHLTLPMSPRGVGEGSFNVHLTWNDGTHRTVARPTPSTIEAWSEGLWRQGKLIFLYVISRGYTVVHEAPCPAIDSQSHRCVEHPATLRIAA